MMDLHRLAEIRALLEQGASTRSRFRPVALELLDEVRRLRREMGLPLEPEPDAPPASPAPRPSMPAPTPVLDFVPISRIRARLTREVDARGLRPVAAEVGRISPTGLRKFLDGAKPYAPNRARLQRWWLAHRDDAGSVSAGDAGLAIDVLLRDLAPAERAAARVDLLERIRRQYVRDGVPLPDWLAE
jgi:hypothetical protein